MAKCCHLASAILSIESHHLHWYKGTQFHGGISYCNTEPREDSYLQRFSNMPVPLSHTALMTEAFFALRKEHSQMVGFLISHNVSVLNYATIPRKLGQLHLIYYRLLSCPSFKEHPRRVLGPFPNVFVWTWNPWAQVSATIVNKFCLVNSLGPPSSIANSHQHCHNSCSHVLASFCNSHASYFLSEQEQYFQA